MFGFLLKIVAFVAMLLAGIAGYGYHLLATPITTANYTSNVGRLCKAGAQVANYSAIPGLRLMTSAKCDCLIRETANRFGPQRAAEMFDVLRSFSLSKLKDEQRRPTTAENEMMQRLMYSSEISRRCNMEIS